MKIILYLSLVAALGVSSYADAQGFHKGRGRGRMHGFEMLDLDQNGKVTLEEMRASKLERWLRADANNDGVVTREEVAQLRKNRGARRFERKDKNNDGLLSRDEVPRMPQAIFDRLDADKNGSLSQSELADRRGQTFEEKNKRFDHLDANGDGQVSKAEIIEHATERFKQLDLNGDNIVDREELRECRYGRGGPFKNKK
jgi:Ca2+-binding EF-hand superfamily protein